MWPAVVPSTSWMLVWFFVTVILFLWLQSRAALSFIGRWRPASEVGVWVGVIAAALLVRLLPMVLLPVGATYDIDSFKMVGEGLLAGEEVYKAAAGRHPYLPLQMYLIGAVLWLSRGASLPFVVLVKLPAVLADVGITAVIFQTLRRRDNTLAQAAGVAFLYALNPISILVSAYHGQFDAIPVLLLLLAWYVWHFDRRYLLSAVLLGLAITSKSWPIVLLPIIFLRLPNHKQRLIYSAVALAIPVLLTAGYLWVFDSEIVRLKRAFTHTGVAGFWGISAIIAIVGSYFERWQAFYTVLVENRRWFILIAGISSLWLTRKQSVLDVLTTIILAVFAVTMGMGIQWLLWVVPFALLVGDTSTLKWYSLAGMVFLLAQLYGLHMYPWAYKLFSKETAVLLIRAASIPAWLVVVYWTGRRLRQSPPAGLLN